MKVRFELKVYLPFLLPRDSDRWGREAFEYPWKDLLIGIVVLPPEKAKEAPKPVEDFSAAHSEDTGETQTWQITTTPHKYFYEVLLIAVTGEIQDRSEIYKPEVRVKYLNAAIRAARRFLDFCRGLARDAEIFFHTPEVSPDRLTFEGFPHCEGWYDPATGQAIGNQTINFCESEWIHGRYGCKAVPWHEIRSAVSSQDEPPLYILMLLDSHTALARYDDLKAVLFAAVAVEVAIKTYLQQTTLGKNILKRLENTISESFPNKYFDLLLRLVGASSLREVDPELFKDLDKMFRARNRIAHEGICYLERDASGNPVPLTRLELVQLLDTAEKTIDWIQKLSKQE